MNTKLRLSTINCLLTVAQNKLIHYLSNGSDKQIQEHIDLVERLREEFSGLVRESIY